MHICKICSTFAAKIEKENFMKTNPDIVESPIYETSRMGSGQEYLTADELMQRLEPHIRSLFR